MATQQAYTQLQSQQTASSYQVDPQSVSVQPAPLPPGAVAVQPYPQPQSVAVQPAPLPPGAVAVQPSVAVQPYPQPQSVAVQPAPLPPGAVAYYPQQPGQVFISAPNAMTPNFNYKANDFFILSVLTSVICGIFSPITLVCSIPALLFSLQSRQSTRAGDIKGGRNNGMVAVYLNIAAIVSALVVACLATGLTIGLYYSDCDYYCYYRG